MMRRENKNICLHFYKHQAGFFPRMVFVGFFFSHQRDHLPTIWYLQYQSCPILTLYQKPPSVIKSPSHFCSSTGNLWCSAHLFWCHFLSLSFFATLFSSCQNLNKRLGLGLLQGSRSGLNQLISVMSSKTSSSHKHHWYCKPLLAWFWPGNGPPCKA